MSAKPPKPRHAPGNLAGTAIVCAALGIALGAAAVYFFICPCGGA